MGNVARLWNPRGDPRLRRYWISFEDRILIGNDKLEQAGVLSLRPSCDGVLRAHLCVTGRETELAIEAGSDITVRVDELELFIGVKAIDGERMLVAFGVPSGSRVNITLEEGAGQRSGCAPEQSRCRARTGRRTSRDAGFRLVATGDARTACTDLN